MALDNETTLVNEGETAEQEPLPVPALTGRRVTYGTVVTVLPILCFLAILFLAPSWQSGQWNDYAALLLSPQASLFFFPLIAYSSISLILLLAAPQRFARHPAVRVGIYTGVLLALQYSILTLPVVALNFFGIPVLFCIVGPFLLDVMEKWLRKRWQVKHPGWWIFGLVVLVLAAVTFLIVPGAPGSMLFILPATMFAAAPFWCLYIMGRTAILLFKSRDGDKPLSLWPGVGWVGWLAIFGGAWSYNLLKAAEIYAALPTVAPDCYVATAAARGHARLVGARPVRLADGGWMRVNRQLQILKLAELALMSACPDLHGPLRACYDRLGRSLARRIDTPFLADLAYLSLKPFEWAARLGLGLLFPGSERLAGQMYGARQDYN